MRGRGVQTKNHFNCKKALLDREGRRRKRMIQPNWRKKVRELGGRGKIARYLNPFPTFFQSCFFTCWVLGCKHATLWSVHLFVHPSICLLVHPSICWSICPSTHPSIHIHSSIYQSIYLPIYLSVHWSIYLPVHPSTLTSLNYYYCCLSERVLK